MMVMRGVRRRVASHGEKSGREPVRTNLKREWPVSSRHEARRDERAQRECQHRKACEPAMTTQRCEPDGHADGFRARSLHPLARCRALGGYIIEWGPDLRGLRPAGISVANPES
jgi:hypothetical protein